LTDTLAWYHEAFQQEYLDLYLHRDLAEAARAVRFLTRALELDDRHRLLDLCCGPGRHLTFLKDRVGRAVGVDLSRPLLRRAQTHGREVHADAADPHDPPWLVRADMRRLPLADAAFDRVVNLFTSFGYFADENENRRVLTEIARLLRPGGLFALDHINRRSLIDGFEPSSERLLPGGVRVVEERHWEDDGRRIAKRVTLATPGGPDKSWRESVRVYDPDELESMLRDAGLIPRDRFGGYAGDPWSPAAERLILIAERAP
jgi:SAM-dependent methyltransferase